MSNETTPSPIDHVRGIFTRQLPNSPIYAFLFSDLVLSSATSTSVTAALTLSSQHVNSRGSLHGAVSAALVDLLGGLAIASTGLEKTGASVDIHVTYQSTANIGDHIEVTAQCEKAGRNLGFTKITIHKLKGEERILVASGSHTKFIG